MSRRSCCEDVERGRECEEDSSVCYVNVFGLLHCLINDKLDYIIII